MQGRTALLAAIACGGLAVAIVAADVAWSLEARIESRADDGWDTIASGPFYDSEPYYRPPAGCPGPELRLVVHNDRPIGASDVRVTASHWNASTQRNTVVLDERWDLGPFESRTFAFRVPDAAFPANTTNDTQKERFLDPFGSGLAVSVEAQVEGIFLGATVCKEASA